jgi:hypothetical protein
MQDEQIRRSVLQDRGHHRVVARVNDASFVPGLAALKLVKGAAVGAAKVESLGIVQGSL